MRGIGKRMVGWALRWLVVIGSGVGAGCQPSASAQPIPGSAAPESPPRGMTLLEAWDTLAAWGKTRPAEAAIALLQSTDVEGDTPAAGQDGRRRGWSAVLVGRDGAQWVHMVDGRIVGQAARPSSRFRPLFRPRDLDSPNALTIARAVRPDFAASEAPGRQGFHFALDRWEGREVVLVIGTIGRWPARIGLDPHTGAVLFSQIETAARTLPIEIVPRRDADGSGDPDLAGG